MIVNCEEFDFDWYESIQREKRKRGNQGGNSKKDYKSIITAFDIETSRIKSIEQSIMYIWQWQFDEEYTVIGRTWEQFNDFVQKLKDRMKTLSYMFTIYPMNFNFLGAYTISLLMKFLH